MPCARCACFPKMKNEKHVLYCLMDVARKCHGIQLPKLVEFEKEIAREEEERRQSMSLAPDRELPESQDAPDEAAQKEQGNNNDEENGAKEGDAEEENDKRETNKDKKDVPLDQRSAPSPSAAPDCPMAGVKRPRPKAKDAVDQAVKALTTRMRFSVQLRRESKGRYRVDNSKKILFIRSLREHIVVRVGGGWDTLENYLLKHDKYVGHVCSSRCCPFSMWG